MERGYSGSDEKNVWRRCVRRGDVGRRLVDVTWKNMELPQTLNSGCYDCFQRDVLLFAQPNRKIISSSLVALVPRGKGVVFLAEKI